MSLAESHPVEVGKGQLPKKAQDSAYLRLADVNLQVQVATRREWTPGELYGLLADMGAEIVQKRGRNNPHYGCDALTLNECNSLVDMLIAHRRTQQEDSK